jgi:hypothetical protein
MNNSAIIPLTLPTPIWYSCAQQVAHSAPNRCLQSGSGQRQLWTVPSAHLIVTREEGFSDSLALTGRGEILAAGGGLPVSGRAAKSDCPFFHFAPRASQVTFIEDKGKNGSEGTGGTSWPTSYRNSQFRHRPIAFSTCLPPLKGSTAANRKSLTTSAPRMGCDSLLP